MCARTHPAVAWVGCWAQARRKYFEAAAERPKAAQRMLRLIAGMYRLEREWDEANVGEKRAQLRQAMFARPLHWLRTLALALQRKVLPGSGLGKACTYLLGHWAPLTEHLRHQTRLDNNLVVTERSEIRQTPSGPPRWAKRTGCL
jgi:hypothetical protein